MMDFMCVSNHRLSNESTFMLNFYLKMKNINKKKRKENKFTALSMTFDSSQVVLHWKHQ